MRRRAPERAEIAPITTEGPRPFWSVMIPTYNSAELLVAALSSVLAQDPGPERMQIMVVDDASESDDPHEVVRDLGQGRVEFFRHGANVGASRNFTRCIELARGEWVHILHSDDVVRPTFYAAYEERIGRCPEAVLIGGGSVFVDESGMELGRTPEVTVRDGYLIDAAEVIARQHPIMCVAAVGRRAAYEMIGGFNPALFHAADWEMWSRLAMCGPVGWVEEPLGVYRQHAASDSERLQRSRAFVGDSLRAAATIAARFPEGAKRREMQAATRGVIAGYVRDVARKQRENGAHLRALNFALRAWAIERLGLPRPRPLAQQR